MGLVLYLPETMVERSSTVGLTNAVSCATMEVMKSEANMNKKVLTGALVVGLLVLPSTVLAWSGKQVAPAFKVTHCRTVSETGTDDPNECSVMVSRFQDGDNYCYVAVQNVSVTQDFHDPSISCVRDEQ